MDLRVAPNLASFSASSALALGHPAARSPVAPADDSPGCPGFFIFRLCRRCSFESPRISHPSALPGLELWVSPQLCSSESASQCGCKFPRTLHLPALPWLEFSGLPEYSLPWLRLMEHPSCLGSRTLRLCRPCVFGSPRILHLRLGG
jgi:hypothetical protein